VLYTHTEASKKSEKLMSTNIREKRNQPVRERKKPKSRNVLAKLIPYLLIHHLKKKKKSKFD
jgi:glutamine synthetase adenylyltransferase